MSSAEFLPGILQTFIPRSEIWLTQRKGFLFYIIETPETGFEPATDIAYTHHPVLKTGGQPNCPTPAH